MNEMEVLAAAAYYTPELVRGVEGEFEITEDGWGQGGAASALEEVHAAQRALRNAGWRRDTQLEASAPYSHNVAVAVYYKRFAPKCRKDSKLRHAVIIATTRFGLHAKLAVHKTSPW